MGIITLLINKEKNYENFSYYRNDHCNFSFGLSNAFDSASADVKAKAEDRLAQIDKVVESK